MSWMEPWMVLPLLVLLHVGLARLEKSKTRVGEKLRGSTWAAWREAVLAKERELDELYQMEPPR